MFKLPDGRLVHGNVFNQLTRKYNNLITQFRITQKAEDYAELMIILADEGNRDVSAFAADIRDVIPGVEVEVKFVREITPTASGKSRYSVREFDI